MKALQHMITTNKRRRRRADNGTGGGGFGSQRPMISLSSCFSLFSRDPAVDVIVPALATLPSGRERLQPQQRQHIPYLTLSQGKGCFSA